MDPRHIDSGIIDEAARVLRGGGVLVFPTQCLYGLGADPFQPDAVARIYQLKRRPEHKPILLLVPENFDLLNLVDHVPPRACVLMSRFWPGSLTLVFHAKKALSDWITAGTGKIGIRVPSHPVARVIVEQFGGPITGTSANLSGDPGASRISDLAHSICNGVELILDAGPLAGGTGSTVVDISENRAAVLREGGVSEAEILSALSGDPRS